MFSLASRPGGTRREGVFLQDPDASEIIHEVTNGSCNLALSNVPAALRYSGPGDENGLPEFSSIAAPRILPILAKSVSLSIYK
jgi:hypothetical protein